MQLIITFAKLLLITSVTSTVANAKTNIISTSNTGSSISVMVDKSLDRSPLRTNRMLSSDSEDTEEDEYSSEDVDVDSSESEESVSESKSDDRRRLTSDSEDTDEDASS
eukprot:CAMPEP_0116057058 /NCGR_PEP_ID=MMETSP0322-20121206/4384_1 /TAXON_ID=163516 /ORGANISM="Leptocylindrus danicus var. apora, Strain B651" /LENGTH=108 /DNA_ID=CAMNT_0003540995 /DNA_START=59 /DNA_END=382 /DNA_ORIENTATION=-